MPAQTDLFPIVLVVDDDRVQVTLLTSYLKKAGFRVVSAPSGDHAVAALADVDAAAVNAISLLVTDLDMPGRDGRQLAAEIRKRHPALKVLYVTGNADRLFQSGRLLGPNESFLEKPVTPELLLEAVNFLRRS